MRYQGYIGVRDPPQEIQPGIFIEAVREIAVSGEIRLKSARWQSGELSQEGVTANHIISIISPEYTMEDFATVVYATWQNKKWVVKTIEYNRPRVNLSLGEVYNG